MFYIRQTNLVLVGGQEIPTNTCLPVYTYVDSESEARDAVAATARLVTTCQQSKSS